MRFGEYEGGSQTKEVGSVLGACLRESGLAAGLNGYKIGLAWATVSGAGRYTLDHYFRGGVLYVRLSSSVVRSGLHPKLESIRKGINSALEADPLFTRRGTESEPVSRIVLR